MDSSTLSSYVYKMRPGGHLPWVLVPGLLCDYEPVLILYRLWLLTCRMRKLSWVVSGTIFLPVPVRSMHGWTPVMSPTAGTRLLPST